MNTITHNSDCQTIKSTPGANSVKLAPTDTPLVSVIVPVYNSAKYIQKAIDSVLDQTYSNYEIIVVDDGSTDETRQKLQRYQNKIRYVFQENQGSATARNTGIKLAKGDLVAFLDSDDFWSMAEKLDKQVACFQGNPDLGGINTGWKIVDGAGKHIKTVQPWHKAPKLDLETWLKKKCVRTSAMMFRKEWLEKVGGFDPELRQSHDVDLILRLSLAGCKTEWLKEETVCYRQHDDNTTKDSLKQAKYVQAVLDKFFARNDLPESIIQQERQIRYHTLVWIAWYQYNAGNLDDMAKFLQQSLDLSPYLKVENISHWLSSFKRFSLERGKSFDINLLTNSFQWQKLISVILISKKTIISNYSLDELFKKNKQVENIHNYDSKIINQTIKKITSKPIQEGQFKNSLEESLEVDLKSADRYRITGDALLSQGHKKDAIKCYQIAVKINPDLFEVHYKLTAFLREKDDLENLIASCQDVLRLKPDTPEIQAKLADALFQRGKDTDLIQAVNYYEQAINADPNNLQLYFKVLEIQPHNLKFYLRLGQKLINKQYWIKALVLLQIAKEVCVDSQEIVFLLKKAFNQQQTVDNNHIFNLIEFNLDSVNDLNFTSAISFFLIGESLKKDKKINEASMCFKKAVELQPDNYKFHHELGNILREQQDFIHAIVAIQKTIELKPDFVWAYHNLGRVFEKQGLIDEAIQSYNKALELNPNLSVSQDALNKLLTAQPKKKNDTNSMESKRNILAKNEQTNKYSV